MPRRWTVQKVRLRTKRPETVAPREIAAEYRGGRSPFKGTNKGDSMSAMPRRASMDLTYIHAVAAFSGSASGTLATVLTGLFTQRRKDPALRRSRATSQNQELYRSFVEEASRLHADALVNDTSDTSQLVDLFALIGRMRILSSDDVIEAAEKTGRLIIETYLSPNKTFVDLPEVLDGMDPLCDFSDACRRELQAVRGR